MCLLTRAALVTQPSLADCRLWGAAARAASARPPDGAAASTPQGPLLVAALKLRRALAWPVSQPRLAAPATHTHPHNPNHSYFSFLSPDARPPVAAAFSAPRTHDRFPSAPMTLLLGCSTPTSHHLPCMFSAIPCRRQGAAAVTGLHRNNTHEEGATGGPAQRPARLAALWRLRALASSRSSGRAIVAGPTARHAS